MTDDETKYRAHLAKTIQSTNEHWPSDEVRVGAVKTLAALDSQERDENYPLWTGTVDYFATGEGRSLMFLASRAANEGDFLRYAMKEISYWFTIGLKVHQGVPPVSDTVANFFLTDELRRSLENQGGHVSIVFKHHVNYS